MNDIKNKKLTSKEEHFVQAYFQVFSAAKAYRIAYDTSAKDEVVWVNAHRVMHKPHIVKRMAEVRGEVKERFIVDIVDKRMRLWQVATDETTSSCTVVAAISELNKMDGDHALVKTNVIQNQAESFSSLSATRKMLEQISSR